LTPKASTKGVDSSIGLVADESETAEVFIVAQVRCDVFIDLESIQRVSGEDFLEDELDG